MFTARVKTNIAISAVSFASLIGLLGLTLWLVGKPQLIRPKASPEQRPHDVRITNLTENSFTVSWLTDAAVSGVVKYGTSADNLKLAATEDQGGATYTLHHITVRPLKPQTTYYFQIQSGSQSYDDAGKPFSITTAAVLSTPPPPKSIYGSVLSSNSTQLLERLLVYIDLPDATPLSTIVNPVSGNWAASISTARTNDLSKYVPLTDATLISIYVQGGKQGAATATITLGKASPVPSLSLGQTYTFEKLASQEEPKTDAEKNLTSTVADPLTVIPSAGEFTIKPGLSPEEVTLTVTNVTDGASLQDTTPTFEGSAPPNSILTITVHSPESITGQVTTDEAGNWSWTPPQGLSPGEHTLTLSYTDSAGEILNKILKFTVYATELSPTPTPRTLAQAPTAIPTIAETQLPVAGNTTTTALLLLAGFAFLTVGTTSILRSPRP